MKRFRFIITALWDPIQRKGGGGNYSLLFTLLFVLGTTTQQAFALQQDPVIISGQVTDPDGFPLPGVNVLEKGTTNGTQTDFDGNFSLEVASSQSVLVFHYLGMVDVERTADSPNLSVQLQEDSQVLQEVVVVGYGTQNRSRVVSAVDQVSSEALEGRPSVNVTQALQGTSPSLIIQQRNSEPGAGINLNIRGISTLGNNSPLVVIDGIVGETSIP